jgi:hypothetical protein
MDLTSRPAATAAITAAPTPPTPIADIVTMTSPSNYIEALRGWVGAQLLQRGLANRL